MDLRVEAVEVGLYETCSKHSDHMPITVDIRTSRPVDAILSAMENLITRSVALRERSSTSYEPSSATKLGSISARKLTT